MDVVHNALAPWTMPGVGAWILLWVMERSWLAADGTVGRSSVLDQHEPLDMGMPTIELMGSTGRSGTLMGKTLVQPRQRLTPYLAAGG